jgi:hypothetical protein
VRRNFVGSHVARRLLRLELRHVLRLELRHVLRLELRRIVRVWFAVRIHVGNGLWCNVRVELGRLSGCRSA